MTMYVPPRHLRYLFPPDITCYEGQSYESVRKKVMAWRNNELLQILYQRDGMCWMPDCDGHVRSDIHEGIITKGDVMGWQPKARRLTINCGYNCLILCDNCHGTPREPKPKRVAEFMSTEYGAEAVCNWILSLSFKTPHPMQIWARRNK